MKEYYIKNNSHIVFLKRKIIIISIITTVLPIVRILKLGINDIIKGVD